MLPVLGILSSIGATAFGLSGESMVLFLADSVGAVAVVKVVEVSVSVGLVEVSVSVGLVASVVVIVVVVVVIVVGSGNIVINSTLSSFYLIVLESAPSTDISKMTSLVV